MDTLPGLCGSIFGIFSQRFKGGLNFGDAKKVKCCI